MSDLRPVKVSIARTRTFDRSAQEQYGPAAECIWIEVLVEGPGPVARIEIEMSLDAFTYALTGAGRQCGVARIGMTTTDEEEKGPCECKCGCGEPAITRDGRGWWLCDDCAASPVDDESDALNVEYLTFEAAALIAEGAIDPNHSTSWNAACLEIARRFRRLEITRHAQRQAMDLDLEHEEVDRE